MNNDADGLLLVRRLRSDVIWEKPRSASQELIGMVFAALSINVE